MEISVIQLQKSLQQIVTMYFYHNFTKKWYLYGFENKTSQETKDFIGYNKGYPMNKPESAGMLETGTHIIQSKCFNHSRNLSYAVPYFNTTVFFNILIYKKSQIIYQ